MQLQVLKIIHYYRLFDHHAPFQEIKCISDQPPWVTGKFLSLIDAREYKASQYNKCPCQLHFEEKKNTERLAHRIKNQLKWNYIENMLNEYKDDPKKLWQNI